jgi:hypothetical protein
MKYFGRTNNLPDSMQALDAGVQLDLFQHKIDLSILVSSVSLCLCGELFFSLGER